MRRGSPTGLLAGTVVVGLVFMLSTCGERTSAPQGSPEDPVPLRTGAPVGDGWNITVLSVKPDAAAEITANHVNGPPPAGKQFFMVTLEATYTGDDRAVAIADLRFNATDPTHATYSESEHGCGQIPASLPGKDLASGEKVRGNVCWTVPSATADSLVMVVDNPEDGRVFFSLRRPDNRTAPTLNAVSPPAPSTNTPLGTVRVRLGRVATLPQPLALAAPAGEDVLYMAGKEGRLWLLRPGRRPEMALDLRGEVSSEYEQGLLGVAISPDKRFLYVNYTDTSGDTHVTELAMAGGRPDPATRRDLLFVDQPATNHNGGNLAFGPDGKLWVALGDGGAGAATNAQRLDTLLGKVLRIDPRPSGGAPYGVPADNPFVGRPGIRPEIWSYGLRNPWRYSFDRATGDLWLTDVGEGRREEINFRPAGSGGGENYGWNLMEGNVPSQGAAPRGAIAPIHAYPLTGTSCAVVGGFVYRGRAIPGLVGAYVYGDNCDRNLRAMRQRDGKVVEHGVLGPEVEQLASFGEDQAGELYAMSREGGIYRLGSA
jgi:glucose/arabinose dehydrogenase